MKIQDRVTLEKKDGIAEVRLARADKLNAMDMPMFSALAEAGLEAAADRSVRAIVLSGEGRAFSAGLDVQSVMGSIGQRREKPGREEPQLFDGTDESHGDRRHGQHRLCGGGARSCVGSARPGDEAEPPVRCRSGSGGADLRLEPAARDARRV